MAHRHGYAGVLLSLGPYSRAGACGLGRLAGPMAWALDRAGRLRADGGDDFDGEAALRLGLARRAGLRGGGHRTGSAPGEGVSVLRLNSFQSQPAEARFSDGANCASRQLRQLVGVVGKLTQMP